MKHISLTDIYSKNVITIDVDSLLLHLEIDGVVRDVRLKKYHAEILNALFEKHPQVLSYPEITKILSKCGLAVYDETRLHRKISEIRRFLAKLHPSLSEIIVNTRGVGYAISLRFKNLEYLTNNEITFKNQKISENISIISGLIENAIHLTSLGKIVQNPCGYVMKRDTKLIQEKISLFNKCEQEILQEIRMHEADFVFLRIQYLLVKLKTYIGLARVSTYAISHIQWLDWFKSEIYSLFDDLKKMIKESEC